MLTCDCLMQETPPKLLCNSVTCHVSSEMYLEVMLVSPKVSECVWITISSIKSWHDTLNMSVLSKCFVTTRYFLSITVISWADMSSEKVAHLLPQS